MYTLTVTDNYGCRFAVSDDVLVTILPPPYAFAGSDTSVVLGLPFNLHGSAAVGYYWYAVPPVSITSAYSQTPTATILADTRFFMETKDMGGCVASSSIFVKALNGPAYYVPNAFTPTGNTNNRFKVIAVGILQTDYFRIYNRWGQLVFETSHPETGWDGTSKGKIQDAGAYMWILRGKDINGRIADKKGTILLLK